MYIAAIVGMLSFVILGIIVANSAPGGFDWCRVFIIGMLGLLLCGMVLISTIPRIFRTLEDCEKYNSSIVQRLGEDEVPIELMPSVLEYNKEVQMLYRFIEDPIVRSIHREQANRISALHMVNLDGTSEDCKSD